MDVLSQIEKLNLRIRFVSLIALKYIVFVAFVICNQARAEPSVAFFYGKQPPILDMCMYNILVVDPVSTFNPTDCMPLSEAIAYVSVGEVAHGVSYEKNIRPEWIMGKNVAWNNNLVIDQTQKDWQTFFLNQVIDPLWKKGYRGFFLDTLDSYALSTRDLKQQQKQIDSIVSLIQQIKSRYPNSKIILNRGFQFLPRVHSQIYAVAIESLYHAWNQAKKIYELTPLAEQKILQNQIDKIRQMQLPIIIIDYLPPSQRAKAQHLSAQLANQGLIPWITDSTLQQNYIKKTEEVPRKILMMFDDDNNLPIQYAPVLRYIAPILEYRGYVPQYFNLNETRLFPTGDLKHQYAGIILWLESQSSKNIALLNWVQKQIKHDIPVVFLNGFGVPFNHRALAKLNLSTSLIKNSIKSLQIEKIDPRFVGYEVKPSINPYQFYPLQTHSSQILLKLKNDNQQTEDAVAITPWGGYALAPYVIQFLPDYYALWVLEPFKFFQQALRLQDFPIPDTTTENGRRLMSVHIDGDGFSYPAKWVGGRFAAEELREHVLKKFPIPTSVSVITGEIAPNGMNPNISPQLMDIARSIFALPWVEIASHTFSHPYTWQKSAIIDRYTVTDQYTVKVPNYTFNLHTELVKSVDFINQYLAPADKKNHLIFWSGSANPPKEALEIAKQNHLFNINGLSDTNIDNNHPSLTGIRPMGMQVGEHYQIFAPIQMDFAYTNSFNEPLYSFENVIQTLERTDKPRRFKPIDIYYHIYTASYPAPLQSLIKIYYWALTQPVMNIYISDYIKKVLDFYHIIIAKNNGSWMIFSKGNLRELRSLRHLGYPDLTHSTNVIGFKENKEDLYIHLGPNRLTVLNYQQEKPNEPYLISANAPVIEFYKKTKPFVDNNPALAKEQLPQNQNTSISELVIKFKGYMPLQFTLANISQCRVISKSPLNIKQNPDNTINYLSSEECIEIHIYC